MEGHHVRSAFWRNEDGSWICIDSVTLLYMGIDLAIWLDEQIRKLSSPSH
jgi:hypothetical protein